MLWNIFPLFFGEMQPNSSMEVFAWSKGCWKKTKIRSFHWSSLSYSLRQSRWIIGPVIQLIWYPATRLHSKGRVAKPLRTIYSFCMDENLSYVNISGKFVIFYVKFSQQILSEPCWNHWRSADKPRREHVNVSALNWRALSRNQMASAPWSAPAVGLSFVLGKPQPHRSLLPGRGIPGEETARRAWVESVPPVTCFPHGAGHHPTRDPTIHPDERDRG